MLLRRSLKGFGVIQSKSCDLEHRSEPFVQFLPPMNQNQNQNQKIHTLELIPQIIHRRSLASLGVRGRKFPIPIRDHQIVF